LNLSDSEHSNLGSNISEGNEIDIIGCGGVTDGSDVFEHILCGASAVQVGTQLTKDGVKIFDRLELELKNIMINKGYTKISDFKGKLKVID
jgi:dihydroorotate dehydrogenase (fumarate)